MDCEACNMVSKGQVNVTEDDHYGGCIPCWVETEDVWSILSKPHHIDEVERDLDILDIDSDVSE